MYQSGCHEAGVSKNRIGRGIVQQRLKLKKGSFWYRQCGRKHTLPGTEVVNRHGRSQTWSAPGGDLHGMGSSVRQRTMSAHREKGNSFSMPFKPAFVRERRDRDANSDVKQRREMLSLYSRVRTSRDIRAGGFLKPSHWESPFCSAEQESSPSPGEGLSSEPVPKNLHRYRRTARMGWLFACK